MERERERERGQQQRATGPPGRKVNRKEAESQRTGPGHQKRKLSDQARSLEGLIHPLVGIQKREERGRTRKKGRKG
jgi:hypothetical protein